VAKRKHVFVNNSEPSYTGEDPASSIDIIHAMNWYNEEKTEKDAAKILGCELKIARNHRSYAWAVQMRSRGFIFPETTEAAIHEMKTAYDAAVEASKIVKSVIDDDGNEIVVAPVVNLQERIAAKTKQYIGELEGLVDDYGQSLTANKFKAYDWFIKSEVKPIHATKIADWFRVRAAEILDAIEGADKEYRDAYLRIGKDKVKNILAVMTNIVSDAERLSGNVSKTRKPRKKKPVSFEKMASKVQYKPKDDKYKIQSINPVNIIGASQVWFFNTKSRKLGVYSALDSVGLLLKGTKVENHSIQESYLKTLRQPEKVLATVIDGGKIALRKLMDSINAKSSPTNGKFGKDVVILRVIK
jgi:hypothetical protein